MRLPQQIKTQSRTVTPCENSRPSPVHVLCGSKGIEAHMTMNRWLCSRPKTSPIVRSEGAVQVQVWEVLLLALTMLPLRQLLVLKRKLRIWSIGISLTPKMPLDTMSGPSFPESAGRFDILSQVLPAPAIPSPQNQTGWVSGIPTTQTDLMNLRWKAGCNMPHRLRWICRGM